MCETSDARNAGAMRFCWLLEQERHVGRMRPSTWTDRCPAECSRGLRLAGWSLPWKAMRLVEVLSRTVSVGCNCKRGASRPVHIPLDECARLAAGMSRIADRG